MPTVKQYLQEIYRTQSNGSRKGCLRLDMNESVPGLTNEFVQNVISELNADFLAQYPEYHNLLKKIADAAQIQPDNICLSNGSDAAIKYIFDAYVSPSDKVLLTDPTFAMYPVYSKIFNAQPIVIEYQPDMSFPAEQFLEKLSTGVKIAIVVNPNNPTGTLLKREDLLKIIETAQSNDVLIIVDEAYFHFGSYSVIDLVRKYDNLIVLRTFSKICSIAAARIGYAAACPQVIENLTKVKPTFDVSGLAVLLAERILDHPSVLESVIDNMTRGKMFLTQKLDKEGLEYSIGYGNFILIKCGSRVSEIIDKLNQRDILISGKFKQLFLQDYIRVTLGDVISMQRFWESFIDIWQEDYTHTRR